MKLAFFGDPLPVHNGAVGAFHVCYYRDPAAQPNGAVTIAYFVAGRAQLAHRIPADHKRRSRNRDYFAFARPTGHNKTQFHWRAAFLRVRELANDQPWAKVWMPKSSPLTWSLQVVMRQLLDRENFCASSPP